MTRFRDEFAIISPVAKVIALVLALAAAAAVALIFVYLSKPGNPPVWMRAWILIFMPCLMGGWVLLVGYVNADAKRRGDSDGDGHCIRPGRPRPARQTGTADAEGFPHRARGDR
jgi:hypothetical protein